MGLVNFETKDRVGIITINRPEALNALNTNVLKELESILDSIDLNEVRAVVVTGSGEKSFVAGADISEMFGFNKEEAAKFGEYGNKVFRKLETHPLPFIAAINGFALGGGNELAMSCDIRYCSDNAVFGQPEVGLGVTAGFGGTQRLIRIIGSRSIAKEIMLTGRNIKADEAYRIGLVSKVFPKEELFEAAMKTATTIAKAAPIAVRKTKEAMNVGVEQTMDDAINTEVDIFSYCFTTKDQKEGMGAFVEKRKEKNFINE